MEIKLSEKVGGNTTLFKTNWIIKILERKIDIFIILSLYIFSSNNKWLIINIDGLFRDKMTSQSIIYMTSTISINCFWESGVEYKYLCLLIFILWGTPHGECSIDVSLFFVIFSGHIIASSRASSFSLSKTSFPQTTWIYNWINW